VNLRDASDNCWNTAPPFHPLGKIGLMLKRFLLSASVFAALVMGLAADPMHAASLSLLAALTFVRVA
jgi:hypothetical protein